MFDRLEPVGFGFAFALVRPDGTPAGTFNTAVPDWRLGDRIESGGEEFRILDIDAANPPESCHAVFTVEAVDN